MAIDLKLLKTKLFTKRYSEKIAQMLRIEIGRKRKRVYEGRTTNSPINTTGKLRRSIGVVENEDGFFSVEGEDYLEKVSEGTDPMDVPFNDLLKWVKDKRIQFRGSNGQFKKMGDKERRAFAGFVKGKILENGLRETNILQDAIDSSDKFLDGMDRYVEEDITDEVEDILLELGYIKKGDTLIFKDK